jgi:hypothetical protein
MRQQACGGSRFTASTTSAATKQSSTSMTGHRRSKCHPLCCGSNARSAADGAWTFVPTGRRRARGWTGAATRLGRSDALARQLSWQTRQTRWHSRGTGRKVRCRRSGEDFSHHACEPVQDRGDEDRGTEQIAKGRREAASQIAGCITYAHVPQRELHSRALRAFAIDARASTRYSMAHL